MIKLLMECITYDRIEKEELIYKSISPCDNCDRYIENSICSCNELSTWRRSTIDIVDMILKRIDGKL